MDPRTPAEIVRDMLDDARSLRQSTRQRSIKGVSLNAIASRIEETAALIGDREQQRLKHPHFVCPECGPGVAADEDACCAGCGADCEMVDPRETPNGQ